MNDDEVGTKSVHFLEWRWAWLRYINLPGMFLSLSWNSNPVSCLSQIAYKFSSLCFVIVYCSTLSIQLCQKQQQQLHGFSDSSALSAHWARTLWYRYITNLWLAECLWQRLIHYEGLSAGWGVLNTLYTIFRKMSPLPSTHRRTIC